MLYPSANNMLFSEYLTASRFYVALHLDGSYDSVDGLYMECKGLKYYQDVVEFAEVFPQKWGKSSVGRVHRAKLPGNEKIDNISLRRGMNSSDTLWNWIAAVQNGGWSDRYKSGALSIYRQDGSEGARFAFERAWPVSYTVSDTTVSSTDLAVEDLELACEVLVRVPTI